jgi:pimeloyl-ACP methyl ester carboxylesterase
MPRGALIGWRAHKPSARRRIVVFHGNGGYALHRSYYVEGLQPLGWEVYLFEYPGYGSREGSPGKDSFLATGRAAVDQLLAADSRPLYLLGESIGSGTACSLAADKPDRIAGLLLVVPFARLVEVAKTHFPYLPVGLILRDKYDNIASLAKYRGPVAFALAEDDEVIPAEQARKLHAAYAGPKLLVAFPEATHNNFPTHPEETWWRQVTEFLDRR